MKSLLVASVVLVLVVMFVVLSLVRNYVPQPEELQLQRYNPACCKIASQHTIEELCPVGDKKLEIGEFGDKTCSCTQFLRCKLVIVAAFSDNHFKESLDLFGSVYEKLPHKKFIVYDLGLTLTQLHAVQSYCNVKEVRKFNFDKYPQHTHNLNNFAWKPFIIEEVSQEFELFLYCDTRCRVKDTFVPFLPNILKFPIISLASLSKSLSVFRFTHQGMLDYFKVTKTRKELIDMMPQTFQANTLLIWANDQFMSEILPYWVDCAHHVDCIAPEGATKTGCNSTGKPFTAYIGCHRFDQSALNVILIREFGELMRDFYSSKKGGIPWERPVRVNIHQINAYNNSRSQQCHIQYL